MDRPYTVATLADRLGQNARQEIGAEQKRRLAARDEARARIFAKSSD